MNHLSGRVARGLDLDDTTRCLVLGNSVRGLDTAGGPDPRLGGGTSDCLAIVGKDDAVVDEGQANRVVRRRGAAEIAKPLDAARGRPYTPPIMSRTAMPTARKRATRKRTSRLVGGLGVLPPVT